MGYTAGITGMLLPFLLTFVSICAGQVPVSKKNVVLSAIKGSAGKPDTIVLPAGKNNWRVSGVSLKNDDKESFHIISTRLAGSHNGQVVIEFKPAANFVGITKGKLQFHNKAGKLMYETSLTGLSTKALEGENEPPLSTVLEALGYQVNLGWTSLSNNTLPALQGDELGPVLFRKAEKGMIEILPVARYSPDFELPFGYYIHTSKGPQKHQAGVLAKTGTYIQHQSLFPEVAAGSSFIDPGSNEFGFYVNGPGHTAYSEDAWNMALFPAHAMRAARIYPVKDSNGKPLKNEYLVCFEEAQNGDYNDYVFLVKNIIPVKKDPFTLLFNEKNLDGWYTYLGGIGKNTDPGQNFRIENGLLHVIGKDVGYVMTDSSYHNYHLKVDFKWGEKRWPPRENTKRDAGICYNIPMNEPDKIWLKTIECQVQEGDVGDFWLIGNSTIEVDGKMIGPKDYAQVAKKKDGEKPSGEWNTVEVISYNGTCVHIVNGQLVNVGMKASLQEGRILLQSEYAEIYYRNVKIRKLDE